ncbi:MAG: hypothetical protein ACPHFX_03460 [Paracoccaceae bacterium]
MSLWSRISEVLSALAKGAPLSEVFAHWSKPPEQTVAFTTHHTRYCFLPRP